MRPLTALSRCVVGSVVAALLAVTGAATAAPAQAATPPGPAAPAPAPVPVDAYTPYRGQTTCDPTVKPGAKYLMNLVLAHWKIGRSTGITRACSTGGQSEHKEGRAIDWALSVDHPAQKAAADEFVAWLTAPGPDGKVGYNARRLGVMYVIWDRRVWNNTSANAAWRTYTGPQPHTDHVHVSLSWAGAYMRSSWWTGVAMPSEAASKSYVTLVYRHLFDRAPDAPGLANWSDALVQGRPRVAVADSITYSGEYRSRLIAEAYRTFLGRSPDPQGLAGWLGAMQTGVTIQTMESGFLASPEYYEQAGNDDAAWVQRLYRHVLARDAAPVEVAGWVAGLAQGHSRQAVALGFLLSTERLSTVVDGYYQGLLGRGIDPVGRQHWVSAIQAGTRTESIIGGIVSSPEYYGKAAGTAG